MLKAILAEAAANRRTVTAGKLIVRRDGDVFGEEPIAAGQEQAGTEDDKQRERRPATHAAECSGARRDRGSDRPLTAPCGARSINIR